MSSAEIIIQHAKRSNNISLQHFTIWSINTEKKNMNKQTTNGWHFVTFHSKLLLIFQANSLRRKHIVTYHVMLNFIS